MIRGGFGLWWREARRGCVVARLNGTDEFAGPPMQSAFLEPIYLCVYSVPCRRCVVMIVKELHGRLK
jgi:hypothetical protein